MKIMNREIGLIGILLTNVFKKVFTVFRHLSVMPKVPPTTTFKGGPSRACLSGRQASMLLKMDSRLPACRQARRGNGDYECILLSI